MPANYLYDKGPRSVVTVKLLSDVVSIIDAAASFDLKSRSEWLREAIVEKLRNDRVMDRYAEIGLHEVPVP